MRERLPAKIVFDAHDADSAFGSSKKGLAKKVLEAFVATRADGITATCKTLAERIRQTYGNHLAVDVIATATPFLPATIPPKPENGSAFRVFYMGQLGADRGLDDLIEAITLTSGAEAHVLGGDDDRIRRYRELAAARGIADRVFFHGFVEPARLPELVARADAFVVPPKAVGRMPYVMHTKVFDCMAGGRPIIASRLPSIEEFLTHEVSALLVEPGAAESIAAAMERLATDVELADGLAARAFDDAKTYTYENRAAGLEELFRRLLG
jgi:glycosyltransferase involved in cell wall biosynthesis